MLVEILSPLVSLGSHATDWVTGTLVVPVLEHFPPGLRRAAGDPREIGGALLIALLQISVIAFVLRPLESLAEAERWEHRKLAALDRTYTLLMLLGLFPLFSFLVLSPFVHLFADNTAAAATAAGDAPEGLRRLVPWFEGHPFVLFAVYYVVYDFVYYWMHRAQHAIPWWWALHSMHHSQRQMGCWCNDRGNYLDGMLQSVILAAVGVAMGVDASQFALLVMVTELVQSLSHTNVRWGFGRLGERLLVDPRFHRLHHMLRDPARPALHNCNFGQVLPWWDMLFRTALYGEPLRATGVSDPVVDADNGRGLVTQQWFTLKRFWATVRRPAGWRLGDVAFHPDNFAPIHDADQPADHTEALRAGQAANS